MDTRSSESAPHNLHIKEKNNLHIKEKNQTQLQSQEIEDRWNQICPT